MCVLLGETYSVCAVANKSNAKHCATTNHLPVPQFAAVRRRLLLQGSQRTLVCCSVDGEMIILSYLRSCAEEQGRRVQLSH